MKRLFCLLLLVCLAPLPALADFDPPGRVARVGWIDGSVFLRNTHYVEWQRLAPNWPVTTGDVLWTGAGARLELRVGSSVLRLDSGSELEVIRIDDDDVTVMLHSGSAAVQLRSDAQASGFTLRTGDGNAMPLQAGSYRFDRSGDTTVLSVRNGRLSFAGSDGQVEVGAGQRIEIWNSGSMNYSGYLALRGDHFADWVDSRERHDEARLRPRHVSQEMTGYEDLHDHGQWVEHDEFGAMWYPAVLPVGWAPYRTGRWVWVAPWGWNWVDEAAWGFAPFHYGRWVHHHGRWAWVPGRYVARPVYAPALVVWIGAAGFATVPTHHATPVGWFPLGPREVFRPGYRVTPIYERKLNAAHLERHRGGQPERMVAPARYRNRGVADAVTVVPANIINDARPVAPARLAQAPRPDAVALTAPPLAPLRPSSVRGATTEVDRHARPRHGIVPSPAAVVAPPAASAALPTSRDMPPAMAGAIDRRRPPVAAVAPVVSTESSAAMAPVRMPPTNPARTLPATPAAAPLPAPALPSAIDRRPPPGMAPNRDPRVPQIPSGASTAASAAASAGDRRPPVAAGMPFQDSRPASMRHGMTAPTPAPAPVPLSATAPPRVAVPVTPSAVAARGRAEPGAVLPPVGSVAAPSGTVNATPPSAPIRALQPALNAEHEQRRTAMPRSGGQSIAPAGVAPSTTQPPPRPAVREGFGREATGRDGGRPAAAGVAPANAVAAPAPAGSTAAASALARPPIEVGASSRREHRGRGGDESTDAIRSESAGARTPPVAGPGRVPAITAGPAAAPAPGAAGRSFEREGRR